MAKEDKTDKDRENVTDDGQPPGETGTFTDEQQKVINALLADERRKTESRIKGQFDDYDDLLAKAAKLNEIEEAQKSELEKAHEAKAKAEAERTEALQTANERLIQAEFISQASRLGVLHPKDAYALADRSAIAVENGEVVGVDQVVKELVEGGRLPLSGKPVPPDLNGSAGANQRPSEKDKAAKMTEAEKEMADKLQVSAEDYAKNKE